VLDPAELFDLVGTWPDGDGLVLVQALDGFVDAGGAVRLARGQLLADCAPAPLVSFDVDQLYDYRARRPEMLFVTDHWESVKEPRLGIDLLHDADDRPFLLLSGPEPDVQWERFVRALQLIIGRLNVRRLVGLNAIPMGVPHTRPTNVIAHGTPQGLVADYSNWLGTVQVPASAGHLLEFRLGKAGLQTMGFAVNVPHYLAHLDYPAAAATLLECGGRAGGRRLGPGAVRRHGARTAVRRVGGRPRHQPGGRRRPAADRRRDRCGVRELPVPAAP
jgi:hypothetical protein